MHRWWWPSRSLVRRLERLVLCQDRDKTPWELLNFSSTWGTGRQKGMVQFLGSGGTINEEISIQTLHVPDLLGNQELYRTTTSVSLLPKSWTAASLQWHVWFWSCTYPPAYARPLLCGGNTTCYENILWIWRRGMNVCCARTTLPVVKQFGANTYSIRICQDGDSTELVAHSWHRWIARNRSSGV